MTPQHLFVFDIETIPDTDLAPALMFSVAEFFPLYIYDEYLYIRSHPRSAPH